MSERKRTFDKLLTIVEYRGKNLRFETGDNNPEFKELFRFVDGKVKQPEQDCCKDNESVGRLEQVAGPLMAKEWELLECKTCGKIKLKLISVS